MKAGKRGGFGNFPLVHYTKPGLRWMSGRDAWAHSSFIIPHSSFSLRFLEEKRACKPGFVSPTPCEGDGMAIPLGRASRRASSTLPGNPCGSRRARTDRPEGCPIWSCTGWGLPCHPPYSGRGELLPRRFTLTRPRTCMRACPGRFVFCGTFHRLAASGR